MLFKLCFVPLFLIVHKVEGQYRFDCEENFCSKKENSCRELDCEEGKGRIVKHITKCGCCDICIESLKEGDPCPIRYYGLNNGNLKECGPGLTCDKRSKKCVPASTKCVEQQKIFDKKKQASHVLQERPQCDEFGNFKEVVCLSDALCYCVDKNGSRIYGIDLTTNNSSMKCDCSQDIKAFPRNVADRNYPRCLPNGNYDPLQCTEELCYCMDSFSPEEDVVSVNVSLERLSCYNKALHNTRLTSKCWQEREKEMAPYRNESFKEVIGLDLTLCDLDGSYSPVQCKKNRCYCVNKDGKPYDNYNVQRNSKAENMTCSCVRDKEFLKNLDEKTKNMEELLDMKCDELGNYKENQHWNNKDAVLNKMTRNHI